MDVKFSEEQEILRNSARGFLESNCDGTFVREMVEDEKGFTDELWRGMAELGWMGLIIPEEYGGVGMGFLELTILLEEMGRAMLPGPFFPTAILSGLSFLEAGSESQRKEYLPKIADGGIKVTLALNEAESIYDPGSIAISAVEDGDGFVINGTKLFVPDAHVADYVLCAARTDQGTEDGITLFIVDGKDPAISAKPLKTIAGDKQFAIVFNDVKVPKENILGQRGQGWSAINTVLQKAAVLKCAEMVGAGQRILDMTTAYTNEREQFGRNIGAFQAIQHHCVNMLTDLEGCRWVTYKAAWMIHEGMPYEKQASIAKAWCNQAYRRVVALGIQVHGGVGYIEEHDFPLYFRRARAAEAAFGDADYHRKIVADQIFTHGAIDRIQQGKIQ
jgi:alkylation response protein AidB-like acyl-CoA dehydrogenase